MSDRRDDPRSADLLHGGNLASVQALFPDACLPWLDLSTGINPWPFAYASVSAEAFEKLPTASLQARAISAAANAFGCGSDRIVLTPGSQAAIQLMPLLCPMKRVGILGPTYSEHALSWLRAGAEVVQISALPNASENFDAVVVVNPNNPDGRIHSHDDLLRLASDLEKKGGHIVVDEAFADTDRHISLAATELPSNVALLRSFGKFFGLAGVRLGAIISSPALVKAASLQMGPWAVSGPALEIGSQAYQNVEWQNSMRARLAEATFALDQALGSVGIPAVGGTTLFRWIKTNDAHHVWRTLAGRGVYTRRFAWSATHLRIGIPATDVDRQRLIEALRTV
ncbi:MAG: threonine-phosphate decarboxylase [Burkholderiales bacterium]|nr:MAG: threonine-phosphate decarboxylase [Burkholderiales bacterium]